MSSPPANSNPKRELLIFINKLVLFLARRWELLANGLFGLILGLSLLAPLLTSAGLPAAGQSLYRIYATQNHQIPQRSYFLFGPEGGFQSYSVETLVAAGVNPGLHHTFIGSPELGYKMALNHRMAAIFLGLFVGGLLWSSTYVQPKIGRLALTLMTLPMMLDGIGHMISERTYGLHEANLFIIWLTGASFPMAFYNATTVGSLNWILRTVSGILFALGTVWYLYPFLDRRFTNIRRTLEPRLRKIGAID